ncbi:hypothetical protein LCGC14_1607360, partial [marine sediment metagenome]
HLQGDVASKEGIPRYFKADIVQMGLQMW